MTSVLRLLLAILLATTVTTPLHALEDAPKGIFIPATGEYTNDPIWTSAHTIGVTVDVLTGGTTTFVAAGTKYAVCVFIGYVGEPRKFWLDFVQHWRYEMELEAPEDFASMTAMLLDGRFDIGLLQRRCSQLEKEKHWDEDPRFEGIYAQVDGNIVGTEFAGAVSVFSGSSIRQWYDSFSRPDVVLPETFRAQNSVTDWRTFETLIIKAGERGHLKALGIPEGAIHVSLRYGALGGGGYSRA